MIRNIKKLYNFGIFKSCDNSKADDFLKYNLIYGWNGTGKSTLSYLFELVQERTNVNDFPGNEFVITDADNNQLTNKNISSSLLNIRTFNKNFIKQNIDWDNAIKSILLIDKEKIDDRKKLNELKLSYEEKNLNYLKEEKEIKDLESSLSNFMTSTAKQMKIGLQSIDTSDSYYLNYNKLKLDKFVFENKDDVLGNLSLLDDSEIITVTNSAKPEQKPLVQFYKSKLDNDFFNKEKQKLS